MTLSINSNYILFFYLFVAIGAFIASLEYTVKTKTTEPKITNILGSVVFGAVWPLYIIVNIFQRIFDFK